jgi:hypothetical protein
MKILSVALGVGALVSGLVGCAPGYIKASELEQNGQGPAACNKSCSELGMRMTAMVLVGDTVPGCVCQPVTVAPAAPLTAPPPAAQGTAPAAGAEQGAAASAGGFVVIAAAAAAARQQQLQQQHQQTYKH